MNASHAPIFTDLCKGQLSHEAFEILTARFADYIQLGSSISHVLQTLKSEGFSPQEAPENKTVDSNQGIDVPDYQFLSADGTPRISKLYGLSQSCSVDENNKNVWNVYILAHNGTITGRQVQLLFDDKDFRRRNLPFRFERAEKGKPTEKILQNIISDKSTATEIDKIFLSAGSKKRFIPDTTHDGSVVRYDHIPSDPDNLKARVGSIDTSRFVIIRLTKSGTFESFIRIN